MTSLLLSAQVLLAVAAIGTTPFQNMRVAACDSRCDFDAAAAATTSQIVAVIVVALVTAAVLYLRRKKWAKSWWIALIGSLATALVTVATSIALIAALPAAA